MNIDNSSSQEPSVPTVRLIQPVCETEYVPVNGEVPFDCLMPSPELIDELREIGYKVDCCLLGRVPSYCSTDSIGYIKESGIHFGELASEVQSYLVELFENPIIFPRNLAYRVEVIQRLGMTIQEYQPNIQKRLLRFLITDDSFNEQFIPSIIPEYAIRYASEDGLSPYMNTVEKIDELVYMGIRTNNLSLANQQHIIELVLDKYYYLHSLNPNIFGTLPLYKLNLSDIRQSDIAPTIISLDGGRLISIARMSVAPGQIEVFMLRYDLDNLTDARYPKFNGISTLFVQGDMIRFLDPLNDKEESIGQDINDINQIKGHLISQGMSEDKTLMPPNIGTDTFLKSKDELFPNGCYKLLEWFIGWYNPEHQRELGEKLQALQQKCSIRLYDAGDSAGDRVVLVYSVNEAGKIIRQLQLDFGTGFPGERTIYVSSTGKLGMMNDLGQLIPEFFGGIQDIVRQYVPDATIWVSLFEALKTPVSNGKLQEPVGFREIKESIQEIIWRYTNLKEARTSGRYTLEEIEEIKKAKQRARQGRLSDNKVQRSQINVGEQ